MDEGDRPTDADGSADRDERTEGQDEECRDERTEAEAGSGVDGPADEENDGADGFGSTDRSGPVVGPDGSGARSDDPVSEIESRPDPEESVADAESVVADDHTRTADSAGPAEAPEADESLLYRLRHDQDGVLMWVREMSASVGVVLLVGLLLFGVSGIWPPMVAVESGSMEPNMRVGDLVFVTEPGRLAPDAADNGVGVVTHEVGRDVGYRTFGSYGSVVIYTPPGRTGSPIIHRAMFHVNEGENWYSRADAEYHNAVDCGSLANCPAPHDGFVTLGDNNGAYDQASGLSPPVKAEWVNGVARVRVPYLGYIRLIATGQVELNEAIARTVGSVLSVESGLPIGSGQPAGNAGLVG
jgi:signal peptidase